MTDKSLHGAVLKQTAIADLVLCETVYGPRQDIPRHAHSDAYFCLVLQGSYTERSGRRTRECRTSTVVLHPAGETHSDVFDADGGRCFNVLLNAAWLEYLSSYSVRLEDGTEMRGGLPVILAQRLYNEFHAMDDVSGLVIEGLVSEILAELSRHARRKVSIEVPDWLRRTTALLQEQFAEPLTLTAIAKIAGVHPVHLARAFHKAYGCTLGEYLRQVRVEFAIRELRATARPLSEVALAAGFSSQSHFSVVFKRHTGFTPAQYRNMARVS
ncbi:MAG TPA: AraC family transcriptional regulator [Blastocatellia bacterium]|nr:AraC family transcriptional regulator [Blastocatellia bacterium]